MDARDPVRVLDLRNHDAVDRWRLSGPSVTLTQRPHNRFLQAKVTDSIDEFVADVDGSGPITVVCARGEASAAVAADLAAAGHAARNLAGGMDAWARLLQSWSLSPSGPTDAPDGVDATPRDGVDDTDSAVGPTVLQYRRPASGCLGYAVVSDGEAAVVDPLRAFTDRYVADAADRGASVEYVVDTHLHADHVSGLRSLAAAADATPVVPAPTAARGIEFDAETVADGDTLAVGDAALTAVHAPGHTSDMTAFAVREGAVDDTADDTDDDGPPILLTGDSLFVDGVARPDLERGADGAREFARDLYRTLTDRFARFSDPTLVAPGHHGEATAPGEGGVVATLGECRHLRALGLSESAFVDHVAGDRPERPTNFERVVAINRGAETADDEAAFELELGPNNCAAAPVDAE